MEGCGLIWIEDVFMIRLVMLVKFWIVRFGYVATACIMKLDTGLHC